MSTTTVHRVETIPPGERTAFGRAPCCCCCPVDAVVRVVRLYDYATVHGARVAAERLAFCAAHMPDDVRHGHAHTCLGCGVEVGRGGADCALDMDHDFARCERCAAADAGARILSALED